MDKMREAIASSIRQAKHQMMKLNNIELQLSTIDNHHMGEENIAEQRFNNSNSAIDIITQHHNINDSRDCLINEVDDPMDH